MGCGSEIVGKRRLTEKFYVLQQDLRGKPKALLGINRQEITV